MGILTTAFEATAGKGLLQGLDASRLKVLDVADGVISTARAYNGFVSQLADDADRAFTAARFTAAVSEVAGKIAAEPPEVQATITAFFAGMGFVPKVVEPE